MDDNFPFQLGSTSLSYPNLDLFSNLELLADKFDLVELTLDYPKSLPMSEEQVDRLGEAKEKLGLDYSIHLPLSVNLATNNPFLRQASVENVASTFELVSPLDPVVYTLHLNPMFWPGRTSLTTLFELKELEAHCEAAHQSLKDLKDRVEPSKVAIENLSTDLSEIQDIIVEEGYGRCVDVGHLVKIGRDPLLHFYSNSDSVINLHLHGVVEGDDHQQINRDGGAFNLVGLLEVMVETNYSGPVILEQFDPEHIDTTLETLSDAWNQVRV